MPHNHCYLRKPELVWTMFFTDMLIGLAYVAISITLWALVRKIKIPFNLIVVCFGVFILACGLTHFMEVWTLWNPAYWWSAGVKLVTAVASLGTGVYLYQLRHPIVTVAEAAKLSEQRRLDLEVLTKSLEQRVEERTIELQNAIRARDEFLSIASHELKTPITSLKMQTQMRKRALDKNNFEALAPEKLKMLLERDVRQIDRLTRLIDDMLDISRISTGKLTINRQRFDLCELAKEVLERYQGEFEAVGSRLTLDLWPAAIGHWDRFRIEQVLINLLTNALKYGGGKPVQVKVERNEVKVKLSVSDQGMGIAKENQERIFQRFERAISSTEISGFGLGLYIAKEIVGMHGGRIWVESEEGKGSTFFVELSLA